MFPVVTLFKIFFFEQPRYRKLIFSFSLVWLKNFLLPPKTRVSNWNRTALFAKKLKIKYYSPAILEFFLCASVSWACVVYKRDFCVTLMMITQLFIVYPHTAHPQQRTRRRRFVCDLLFESITDAMPKNNRRMFVYVRCESVKERIIGMSFVYLGIWIQKRILHLHTSTDAKRIHTHIFQ